MARSGRLTELGDSIVRRVEPRLPNGPLLVALSGGADSAACAWAAVRCGRPVRAVHIDHGMPASALLAEAARDIAGELGIGCDVLGVTVAPGPSPESQARSARYAAIESTAREGEWLLSGHTADDQAETVLANLMRGAGARGLSGIPARRGHWVRPLLDVTRTETRELAALAGLPFTDDPENETPRPRRNVLRRQVIPDLEAAFNPDLKAALARAAGLLAADEELLAAQAEGVPMRRDGDALSLPAALLTTLPGPVAARAVRAALREVRPPHGGYADDVSVVLAVAAGSPRRTGIAGVDVVREGPWVTLSVHREGGDAFAAVPLPLPGSAIVPGYEIHAWVEEAVPSPWPLGTAVAVADADVVGSDAVVRCAAEGERIEIVAGSKPVRDVLAEAGVPHRLRPGWPVVATRGKLVWVAGARVARWAAATAGTARYLWLQLERSGRRHESR